MGKGGERLTLEVTEVSGKRQGIEDARLVKEALGSYRSIKADFLVSNFLVLTALETVLDGEGGGSRS